MEGTCCCTVTRAHVQEVKKLVLSICHPSVYLSATPTFLAICFLRLSMIVAAATTLDTDHAAQMCAEYVL